MLLLGFLLGLLCAAIIAAVVIYTSGPDGFA